MCLRSLNPATLCNWARLIIKTLYNVFIKDKTLVSHATGENVFFPKMITIQLDHPFSFKRIQFLMRHNFALRINKSQGQSFKFVGLHLQNPPFVDQGHETP